MVRLLPAYTRLFDYAGPLIDFRADMGRKLRG